MRLVCRGLTEMQIAYELGRSVALVRQCRQLAREKLGQPSGHAAVAAYTRWLVLDSHVIPERRRRSRVAEGQLELV